MPAFVFTVVARVWCALYPILVTVSHSAGRLEGLEGRDGYHYRPWLDAVVDVSVDRDRVFIPSRRNFESAMTQINTPENDFFRA